MKVQKYSNMIIKFFLNIYIYIYEFFILSLTSKNFPKYWTKKKPIQLLKNIIIKKRPAKTV